MWWGCACGECVVESKGAERRGVGGAVGGWGGWRWVCGGGGAVFGGFHVSKEDKTVFCTRTALFINYNKKRRRIQSRKAPLRRGCRIFRKIPEIFVFAVPFLGRKSEKKRVKNRLLRRKTPNFAGRTIVSAGFKAFCQKPPAAECRPRRCAAKERTRARLSSSVVKEPSGSGCVLCMP